MKDNTPQAVQACHDLIRWLIPQLDKFPRSRRYTLGERIENELLEVLGLLVDATYSRSKQKVLKQANQKLAVACLTYSYGLRKRPLDCTIFSSGIVL
ncbi:MAG: hypothetical protein AB2708_01470 [Candidatus Thiodiazotropha taylori]